MDGYRSAVADAKGEVIRARQIVVRSLGRKRAVGQLTCGNLEVPCALGRSGISRRKREGDGATPAGAFKLHQGYFRPDRLRRPQTSLPLEPIAPDAGWCDAAEDRNYNRPVRHPYPASAERMWRKDALYDLVVVIGYNMRPRVRGKGSAIFMHMATGDLKPTEGCVALRRRDLLKIAPMIGPATRIVIL